VNQRNFRTLLSLAISGLALFAFGDAEPELELDEDKHLAGWWKFDEESGKTAEDASSHNRNGTLEGGLSFDDDSVPGRVGNALELSGRPGACVEVEGYKGVTGTQPRTVAAWIKTRYARGEIVAWGSDEAGKMFVFGFIRSHIGVTPQGGYLYGNSKSDDDRWHHVAVVIHPAERPNLYDSATLYKDSEIETIHDIGLLDLWPIDTGGGADVRIGAGFRGIIDDVRIYDRALSDEEIKAIATP